MPIYQIILLTVSIIYAVITTVIAVIKARSAAKKNNESIQASAYIELIFDELLGAMEELETVFPEGMGPTKEKLAKSIIQSNCYANGIIYDNDVITKAIHNLIDFSKTVNTPKKIKNETEAEVIPPKEAEING